MTTKIVNSISRLWWEIFPDLSDPKPEEKTDEKYDVVDYYGDLEVLIESKEIESKTKTNLFQKVYNSMRNDVYVVILLLFCLGSLTSIVSAAIDWAIDNLQSTRNMLSSLTPYFFVNYFLYVTYCVIFGVLSVACVNNISINSPGSGIPEMKAMIGGVIMNRYLSLKNFTGKILGLICAFGSSLSVGREGPFCHFGGMIAHSIMKLSFFSRIRGNDLERRQMLAAACAAGVASVFGAPFGGVIFSVEVTATYFPVGNLWKSVFAALCSSTLFSIWRYFGIKGTQEFTDFDEHPFEMVEYIFFAIEGIALGLLGALFVYLTIYAMKLRKRHKLVKDRPYRLIIIVTIVVSCLRYALNPGLFKTTSSMLTYLYKLPLVQWEIPNPLVHLIIMSFGIYFITIISVSMPIAGGVFSPTFLCGAAFGRLFGEIISITLSFFGLPPVNPLGYAVVGAAAMASGVTRTLSTGVIMFELTGQIRFLVPTLLATVLAVPVANLFTESFYAEASQLRGIPEIKPIRKEASHQLTAADLMRKNVDFITKETTVQRGIELSQGIWRSFYPIVTNKEEKTLLGYIRSEKLRAIVDQYQNHPNMSIFFSKKKKKLVSEMDSMENIFVKSQRGIEVQYDAAPLVILLHTPVIRIFYLFSILGLSHAYVLDKGKLIGVLSKKDLIKFKL